MTCPHCGGTVSRSLKLSPRAKKRGLVVTAAIAIVAVMLTAVRLFSPSVPKEAIVGTWRMSMPVGDVLDRFVQTTEDNTLAESMLAMLREQETVTVYCRFFDDDTYRVYVDPEEVIAVADKALDTAVAYVCEEGIDKALGSGELPGVMTALLLGVANASSDELVAMLGGTVDKVMTPLYDRLREEMTVSEETGAFRWLFEDGQLCMALQKNTAVEDGAFVIWQYDDGTLRLVSGTFLDTYLEGLVWEKLAGS